MKKNKKTMAISCITGCLILQNSMFVSAFESADVYFDELIQLTRYALEQEYISMEDLVRYDVVEANYEILRGNEFCLGNLGYQVRDYDDDGHLELLLLSVMKSETDIENRFPLVLEMYEMDGNAVVEGGRIVTELPAYASGVGFTTCYSIQGKEGGYQIGADLWEWYLGADGVTYASGIYEYGIDGWNCVGSVNKSASDFSEYNIEADYLALGFCKVDRRAILSGSKSGFDYISGTERITYFESENTILDENQYMERIQTASNSEMIEWGNMSCFSYNITKTPLSMEADDEIPSTDHDIVETAEVPSETVEVPRETAEVPRETAEVPRETSEKTSETTTVITPITGENLPLLWELLGTWVDLYSQRAYLEINPCLIDTDIGLRVKINWSNGAASSIVWEFSGVWDANTQSMTYIDGRKYEMIYTETGEYYEKEYYTGGTGYFYKQNGVLYCNNNIDQDLAGCSFSRMSNQKSITAVIDQADYVYLDICEQTNQIWGVYYLVLEDSCYAVYDYQGNYVAYLPYGTAKTSMDYIMTETNMYDYLQRGGRGCVIWESPYGVCAYSHNKEEYAEDITGLTYSLNEESVCNMFYTLQGSHEVTIPKSDREE